VTQTAWATIADVASLTGLAASQTQVDQANSVIEVLGGRIYALAVANTGTRDTEWMRRACAFQCAWMLSQPDMFQRIDFEAVSEGGGRPVGLKPDALVLAPMAKRALNRVSWLKSRSLHVRTPFTDGLGPLSTAVMDYDDDGGGF
jgi:hypothetical protein